jgi:hypothetical protein
MIWPLLFLAAQADQSPWPDRPTTPSRSDAQRIDHLLDGKRCIGDIHRWERVYWHPSFTDRHDRFWFDFGKIVVNLKEAGKFGHRDQIILRSSPETEADGDGARLDATAEYDRATGTIKIIYCGPLVGD